MGMFARVIQNARVPLASLLSGLFQTVRATATESPAFRPGFSAISVQQFTSQRFRFQVIVSSSIILRSTPRSGFRARRAAIGSCHRMQLRKDQRQQSSETRTGMASRFLLTPERYFAVHASRLSDLTTLQFDAGSPHPHFSAMSRYAIDALHIAYERSCVREPNEPD